MYVVHAARWHLVDTAPTIKAADTVTPAQRCSVCGSQQLAPTGDTALDGTTRAHYRVMRCKSCGYDLLAAEQS